MNKETTIFIDTQDMEERYGEQLYKEYLEKENKELKEKVNQLETNIEEAIELLSKGVAFCENDSQGNYDICNIAINREKKVKEILERSKD